MDYNPEIRDNFVREEVPVPAVSDEIWKLILDRTKMPEMLVHMLKGEVWVTREVKGEIVGNWEQRGDPLMNEHGIRFFTPMIYSIVTPDKLTTNISEDEVMRLMKMIMEPVIEVIHERGDEFGIPASNRKYVTRQIEWNLFMGLTASRRGTILAALKPMYERKEIYTPQQKGGGFKMPSFLGGR